MTPVYLVSQNSGVLGYLFIFSISEQECVMCRERYGALLAAAGINPNEWLPARVRPIDAFKRAARKAKLVLPGVVYNMSKLKVIGEFLQGKIVACTSDGDRTEGRVEFDKKRGLISYVAETPSAKVMAEEVVRLYEAYKGRISAKAFRAMVNNYLVSLGAMPASGFGGIYFLMPDHEEALKRLAAFLGSIGKRTEGHVVPLYATQETIAYLSKKARDYLAALKVKVGALMGKEELDRCNTDIFLHEIESVFRTLRYLQVDNNTLESLKDVTANLRLKVAGE